MKNRILKLEPFYSEKVWGYEEWTLSTHRNGHSKIKNSDITLINYIGEELPILNKIIKANDTLVLNMNTKTTAIAVPSGVFLATETKPTQTIIKTFTIFLSNLVHTAAPSAISAAVQQ